MEILITNPKNIRCPPFWHSIFSRVCQLWLEVLGTAAAFVANSIYVDDRLVSIPSIKEASELIAEAQELCKREGLQLHKFNSNEREVLSCVEPSERAASVKCKLERQA